MVIRTNDGTTAVGPDLRAVSDAIMSIASKFNNI